MIEYKKTHSELAEHYKRRAERYKQALQDIASFDGWKSDIAKAALEEK